ncbi:hypothetical protein [Gracilimonas mengyeensis]|uniref:Uncharacterized protein n=1 Tax=Gracilimonas mengyeensis TaxID=1302730 RepID=A0A521D583_9BACT|nr:hypothetical protein [Gracilimonas mengyeensis]SMO66848.1 hypothetical protein SAMN06265219_107131 [Gracilimonas mengyeensis]
MKKKILLLVALCSMMIPLQVMGQHSGEEIELEYRKWRVTLFPPLSTNGLEAVDYTARYSINILGGYHGGLDGGELGGLINYNKYYTHGGQLAGLANISGGDMQGVNIAGIGNFSNYSMSGIQVAGLGNVSGAELEGIQFAGLLNSAAEGSSGLQFAGLANVAGGDLEGLQFGGLINATDGSISGLQGAGITNLARNDVEGLQAAGILNFAGGDISGVQAAGVANIARDDVEGLQAAGAINFAGADVSGLIASGGANIALKNIEGLLVTGGANIALEDASGFLVAGGLNVARQMEGLMISGGANIAQNMEGLQFAGFLNASQTAKGLQIGVINIAKEFEGVPIGLISLYGNGRKNMDVRYSDGGFTDIGITLGTYRVYNAAILGYNTSLDRDVYRVGMAVGLEKNIQDAFENWNDKSMYVNQEFSVLHHFEDEWSDKLNLLYSYKYHIGKRFSSGFSIYGGPTFNMLVSRVDGASDYSWYSLWSPKWKGRDYRFWVGFTAGIRLFKQKEMKRFRNEFQSWDIDWN